MRGQVASARDAKSLGSATHERGALWMMRCSTSTSSRTVAGIAFKGLESPVVILWGLDTIDLARCEELLYVGMSRAKSLLLLVARSETCGVIRTRWNQVP